MKWAAPCINSVDMRDMHPWFFGVNEDKPLLGVTALEEMALQVDPVTKQLKPIELLLL